MLDLHNEAQRLSAQAFLAAERGENAKSHSLYLSAAALEQRALDRVPREKLRTRGILAVSLVSVLYKGRDLMAARRAAHLLLSDPDALPDFAIDQLYLALAAVSDEIQLAHAKRQYVDRSLDVKLLGGEIYTGSAPADLAIAQMTGWQALVIRIAEYLGGFHYRLRGLPEAELVRQVAPRLVAATPGSYRFAVRLTEPMQTEMPIFPHRQIDIDKVISETVTLVRILSVGDIEKLKRHVSDRSYRRTITALVRGITPHGTRIREVQISELSSHGVLSNVGLTRENRRNVDKAIKADTDEEPGEELLSLRGNLRAAHLDNRWVVLRTEEFTLTLQVAHDMANDVLGPMLDHDVDAVVRVVGSVKTLIDASLIED